MAARIEITEERESTVGLLGEDENGENCREWNLREKKTDCVKCEWMEYRIGKEKERNSLSCGPVRSVHATLLSARCVSTFLWAWVGPSYIYEKI